MPLTADSPPHRRRKSAAGYYAPYLADHTATSSADRIHHAAGSRARPRRSNRRRQIRAHRTPRTTLLIRACDHSPHPGEPSLVANTRTADARVALLHPQTLSNIDLNTWDCGFSVVNITTAQCLRQTDQSRPTAGHQPPALDHKSPTDRTRPSEAGDRQTGLTADGPAVLHGGDTWKRVPRPATGWG